MNAHEPTGRRLGRSFMLVFALLAAGIPSPPVTFTIGTSSGITAPKPSASLRLRYPLDFLDAESPSSTAVETVRPKGERET